MWKCKTCKKQSSVKVGTIFEDSALGLDKWLPAVWLAANSTNAISSHELARALGTTQKSAWFMLHRIRTATTPARLDSPTPAEPLGEEQSRSYLPGVQFAPGSDPGLFAVIALGLFALGAIVGWFAGRAHRRL